MQMHTRRIRWIAVNCTDGGTDAIRQYTAYTFLNYGMFFFLFSTSSCTPRTYDDKHESIIWFASDTAVFDPSIVECVTACMQMIALDFVLQFSSFFVSLKKLISVIISCSDWMQHFDCENKLNEYKTTPSYKWCIINDFFLGWRKFLFSW